jgi:hypothetical protein
VLDPADLNVRPHAHRPSVEIQLLLVVHRAERAGSTPDDAPAVQRFGQTVPAVSGLAR